jgi:hypothetical protein
VQDADAELAAGVDVWVERYRCLEDHLRGHERVGRGEGQVGAEVASWGEGMVLLAVGSRNMKVIAGKVGKAYRRNICSHR